MVNTIFVILAACVIGISFLAFVCMLFGNDDENDDNDY